MSTRGTERDRWAVAGMAIAAVSAAVASFSGLRGLALAAGWPRHLAWLLPVTLDAYAMTSTRLWLAGRARHRRARRFAAANALGAITASVAGNAVYHAVSTGLLAVSWPIVVSVGAVPAAVLGLIAHLHALHAGPGPRDVAESVLPAGEAGPSPSAEDRTRDRYRVRDSVPVRARTQGPDPSPGPQGSPVPDRGRPVGRRPCGRPALPGRARPAHHPRCAARRVEDQRAARDRPAPTPRREHPGGPCPRPEGGSHPPMTHPPTSRPLVNVEAVRTDFHRACRTRRPVDLWHAVADIPVLLAELSRTRSLLALARMTQANLAAAARATLAAARDGETDPLFYLADELGAQHELPPDDLPATELLPDLEPDTRTDREGDR